MADDQQPDKTAPASSDMPNHDLPDGMAAVKRAADFALTEVLDALREVAREKGGERLTFSEIKFQFEAFMAEPNHDMLTVYENAWKSCAETAKATVWQAQRKFPLERLVVRRFEHLFPPRGTPAVKGQHLARRVISPFMFALQQLLGPELHDKYEAQCREMVAQLQEKHGEQFRWSMFDSHPDADTITNDVLIFASRHFGDFNRRKRWLIDLIDGNLPPPTNPEELPWRFEAAEFDMLMRSLYAGIPEQFADPTTVGRWKKRYDEASLAGLVSLLENLAP
jgi:hypothetical protein